MPVENLNPSGEHGREYKLVHHVTPTHCRKRVIAGFAKPLPPAVVPVHYRELDEYWLIAGIFHARREPDWIHAQLLIREVRDKP